MAKRFGDECFSIPRVMKEERFEFSDEKIGIVFPVFYLGIPKIVEEFLGRVSLKSDYVFAVATYGSLCGAFEKKLLKIGEKAGIKFSYINAVLMIDNYLPYFSIDVQKEKEASKHIEENIAKTVKEVEAGDHHICRHSPLWNLPGHLLEFHDRGFERKFLAGNECTGCGICEKVCPVDNVKLQEKPVFSHNCLHCLACISHCPVKAIRLPGEKSETRFINQHISVKEIIDSNN